MGHIPMCPVTRFPLWPERGRHWLLALLCLCQHPGCLWVCVASSGEQGGCRAGFCDKLLEASPVSPGAKATSSRAEAVLSQG